MGRCHCPVGRTLLRVPTNGLSDNRSPNIYTIHRLRRRAKYVKALHGVKVVCAAPKFYGRGVCLCVTSRLICARRRLSSKRCLSVMGVPLGRMFRVIRRKGVASTGALSTLTVTSSVLRDVV